MLNPTISDVSLTDGASAIIGRPLHSELISEIISQLRKTSLTCIEVMNAETARICIENKIHPLAHIATAKKVSGNIRLRATLSLIPPKPLERVDVLSASHIKTLCTQLSLSGISEVVFIDPLCIPDRLTDAVSSAHSAGLRATIAWPVNDRSIYQLKDLAACNADSLMIRDESGILCIDQLRLLISNARVLAPHSELQLHTRCHSGMGPRVAIEACALGISNVDTALPRLANACSAPSSRIIARTLKHPENARAAIEDSNLLVVQRAEEADWPTAIPTAFDLSNWLHQLPGRQWRDLLTSTSLRDDQLNVFALECALVRTDLGSPPMLEPFASAVSRQALMNIRCIDRFEKLDPVARRIVQGIFGETPSEPARMLVERVGPRPKKGVRPNGAAVSIEDYAWSVLAGVNLQESAFFRSSPIPPRKFLNPTEKLLKQLSKRITDREYDHIQVRCNEYFVDLQS